MEVSDSAIAYDRPVKLPLCSSVGIPEAGIVDPNEDTVEVHADLAPKNTLRSPASDGGHR